MVTQKTILATSAGSLPSATSKRAAGARLRREPDRVAAAQGLVEEHHVMVAAHLAILGQQIGRGVGLGPGRGRIADRDRHVGRADRCVRTTLKFHDLSVSLDQSRARAAGRMRSLPPSLPADT